MAVADSILRVTACAGGRLRARAPGHTPEQLRSDNGGLECVHTDLVEWLEDALERTSPSAPTLVQLCEGSPRYEQARPGASRCGITGQYLAERAGGPVDPERRQPAAHPSPLRADRLSFEDEDPAYHDGSSCEANPLAAGNRPRRAAVWKLRTTAST